MPFWSMVTEKNVIWFLKQNDEVNMLAWFCVFDFFLKKGFLALSEVVHYSWDLLHETLQKTKEGKRITTPGSLPD